MTSRIRSVLRPNLPPHIALSLAKKAAPLSPAVPFFRDLGHTIPTKWALYRPLLKTTTCLPSTRREIRTKWQEKKGLTSVPKVRVFLQEYHDLLDHLRSSDPSYNEETQSLECKLVEKHRSFDESQTRLKEPQMPVPMKPRLTGSFYRPTLFNPPLPRMKPQPIEIGAMIHNRLRARERRIAKRKEYASLLTDMKLEVGFWKSTIATAPATTPQIREASNDNNNQDWVKGKDPRSPGGWDGTIKNELKLMDERFEKEHKRSEMVFDQYLLKRVGKARQRRDIWWKELKEKKKKGKDESSTVDGPT
ncbi:uncharacterized protein IL334_000919 [Kwoniella shivajii]|uniref:Mitochondrial zinc maintenance protein 1, mitochondrial n=1 Tax=Kwoniella shivajii TaxID=564305 RepID=A0ABZ1CRK2_9TREE|nr:hypothetical protein IL334_000919 [Kwoniella shivajii]